MRGSSSRYGYISLRWYAWLPSVIASTPEPSSSLAIFGVIPSPPATFSALTTTNVGS
jgi:hypothetical protein